MFSANKVQNSIACYTPAISQQKLLDEQLVTAYRNKSFAEVERLIKLGANPEQRVSLNKKEVLEILESSFLCISETSRKKALIELLDQFILNDLSIDKAVFEKEIWSKITLLYTDAGSFFFPCFSSIGDRVENLQNFLNRLHDLPLIYLAIINKQEKVVEAALAKGFSFKPMTPQASPNPPILLPETLQRYISRDVFLNYQGDDSSFVSQFMLNTKNHAALDLLLKCGIYPTSTMSAVLESGHTEISKQYIDSNFQANSKNNNCNSELMFYAAKGGNPEVIEYLLNKGYTFNDKDSRNSGDNFIPLRLRTAILKNYYEELLPFEVALLNGHTEAASLLLRNGDASYFNPSLNNERSKSLLMFISRYGKPKSIEFLLELGCPLEFTDDNNTHTSLLKEALETNNEENIRFAVSLGLDINQYADNLFGNEHLHGEYQFDTSHSILTPLQLLDLFFELGGDLSHKGVAKALIDDATYFGYEKVFDSLVQKLKGQPFPLHPPLIHYAAHGGSPKILKKLIKIGAFCSFIINNQNALFFASNVEVAKILAEEGLDFNHKDDNGETPLFFVDEPDILRFFIDQGANVNHQNEWGETPLFIHQNIECIKLLIQNGADPYHKDNNGTPFFFNYVISLERLKGLVQLGVDINQRDHLGDTLLLRETRSQSFKSSFFLDFIELLEGGCDPSCKNNDGETALDRLLKIHSENFEQKSKCYPLDKVLKLLNYN